MHVRGEHTRLFTNDQYVLPKVLAAVGFCVLIASSVVGFFTLGSQNLDAALMDSWALTAIGAGFVLSGLWLALLRRTRTLRVARSAKP